MIMTPFSDTFTKWSSSESLLKRWRQERAARIGKTIAHSCMIFLIFIIPLDFIYSIPSVYLTDLLFLLGCGLSLMWSKPNYFAWLPLYLGFWINSIPSIHYAGGLQSPFLGLYVAIYFTAAMVIQNQVSPLMIFAFTGVNFVGWVLQDLFFPIQHPSILSLGFTAPIILIMVTAIIVFVYGFFKSETGMTEEIFKRYQELANTKADLEKEELASSAKSSFIANVSHELRTPLGAILGYTEILLDEKSNLKKEQTQHLETVLRNGHKLLKLVDDLLDISKIEAGKIEFEILPFKPREILNDVVKLLKVSAEKKGLALIEEVRAEVPAQIKSDPLRFQQILLNVIGNAIKFTEDGSVKISMSYSVNRLQVQVSDTGRGITSREQTKLFKPFSQVDASMTRQYGGTGLGLNLARKMAQVMGGDLELTESRLGEGSVFTFSISVEPCEDSTTVPIIVSELAVEVSLKGKSLLVVDDSLDNQELIQTYLKSLGADIQLSSNGADAIQKAETEYFDLILMDVQMPVLDGLQATQILRAQGFIKPIVALTAHAMKEDKERCLASGCNAYLTKPLNRQMLVQTIRELIH